jgi:hypothetical protein
MDMAYNTMAHGANTGWSADLSVGGTAAKQVQDQRNHCNDQEKVNRSSCQVKPDPHHKPNAQQHQEQDKKDEIAYHPHVSLLPV